MAISLRVVFASTTAIIVLIVAATTLAITLTVSLAAVQNTGQSLAEAISNTVKVQVEAYNGKAEDQVWDYSDRVKRTEYVLPTNDTTPNWWDKWLIPMDVDVAAVNYDYVTMSVLFDDGGMASAIPTPGLVGLVVADPHTLATTRKCTFQTWIYNTTTMQVWTPSVGGPASPLNLTGTQGDQRVPGYYSFLQFAGPQRACLWFAPTLDLARTVPQFIVYGSCTLRNATNTLLGISAFGRDLSGIGTYLGSTSKTPNTQLFLVDNYQLMVATTNPAPFQFTYPPGKALTPDCVSSKDADIALPEIIDCRSFVTAYPYAPLVEIATSDPAFITQSGTDSRFGTLNGDPYYYISTRISSRLGAYTLNLLLFLPEADVLGNIVQGRNIAIIVTAVVFLFACGLTTLLTGILLRPLDDVARRMYQTAQLQDDDSIDINDAISLVTSADDNFTAMDTQRRSDPHLAIEDSALTEIKALQVAYNTLDNAIKSFTRYVPREVVKELMLRNELCEIAMRPTHCSVLFTDIQGFTSICERVPPPALSTLVRVFFQRASREVMAHGGVIDKFIGDCVMAVWGAPMPVDHAELRASLCARMLVYDSQHEPLKSAFEGVGETLAIRVGVASGEVLAGNMGSEVRMSYTVIGDEVNLSSRLEALNKQWGTNILISQATADECVTQLIMRFVVQVAVVGKAEPVRVYEVVGVRRDAKLSDLGTSAADASENVTITQAKYDAQRRELDETYGAKKPTSPGDAPQTNGVATAATLLRRCRAKVTLPDAEILFVNIYDAAMHAFVAGDFIRCRHALESLIARSDVPEGCADRVSVVKLMRECENFIAQPPTAFNGVWVASEK